MKELEQKYIDILEQNDWGISSYTDDGRVELETYSPAGENFLMCVEVENFPESVREYANDFDADEHTEMWIEARGRVAGVPNSIRELIEDAEAIKEMLNELADTLVKDENNKENLEELKQYKENSKSYFINLWNNMKSKFGCGSSYKDLNPIYFEDAIKFISSWKYEEN